MGCEIARDLVRDGAAAAMADYQRYVDVVQPDMEEPTLKAAYPGTLDEPDHELAARLRAMHDLPAGTLGYEYVEFYRRNGLTLPGDDPNMPAVFVAHDMCHVIGGYEPTGQGEIALGAMQLAVTDSDAHWIGFLGNLAIHEAGYFSNDDFTPKQATLTRPGAPALVARAMWRGRAAPATSPPPTTSRWRPCRSTRCAPATACPHSRRRTPVCPVAGRVTASARRPLARCRAAPLPARPLRPGGADGSRRRHR